MRSTRRLRVKLILPALTEAASPYREFYRWSSIARGSLSHDSIKHQAKHFFYAAGWKKFEPLCDVVIRARQLRVMTPLLEGVLSRITASDRIEVETDDVADHLEGENRRARLEPESHMRAERRPVAV